MDSSKILFYVLVMSMGVMLFALLQNHMVTLNTTGWTFEGHAEAAALLQITPYLFLIGLVTVPIYLIAQEVD